MARPILLAVDDDVSVLEAVVQDLRRQYGATYRIMRAASGQAALDTLAQVKTRQEPVALLVSDQRMPGMTAWSSWSARWRSIPRRGGCC
jgi:thioredoxin reductase (NADPH)